MSILNNPVFRNERKAFELLESIVWSDGKPVCPHCKSSKRVYELKGETTRMGLKKCSKCRKQFTVKVGTLFEGSHIPLHKWFQAVYLLAASKKGMSAHQLHRTLGITYKTAWFMSHRIRSAMTSDKGGLLSGIVEMDETYFGNKKVITTRTIRGKAGHSSKRSVVAIVQRQGTARSFHVQSADKFTIMQMIKRNIAKDAHLLTDESRLYKGAKDLGVIDNHHTICHSAGEYERNGVHTNTVEGLFSLFKRGMRGIYHHCGERHLHRYLAEFDFRYNTRHITDFERTIEALKGISGKRLMYKRI